MTDDPVAAASWSGPGEGERLWFLDSETARALVLSTPAGLERMVRDAAVPATRPTLPPADTLRPTPEERARVFEAHGQVNLGPSLGPDD